MYLLLAEQLTLLEERYGHLFCNSMWDKDCRTPRELAQRKHTMALFDSLAKPHCYER
jgi:hypothetical protein